MKVTTKTRYGLRALIYIAENSIAEDSLVRIKDISENQKISVQYLEQILFKLKKSGMITGKTGPNGGYRMLVSPGEITIDMVFNILESNRGQAFCDNKKENCVGKDCSTIYLWNKLNTAVENVLSTTTLQEMIDVHNKGKNKC